MLAPPNEERPRRWVKLLLYRTGAGFGELDAEDVTTLSGVIGPPLNEAGMPAVSDDRFRA